MEVADVLVGLNLDLEKIDQPLPEIFSKTLNIIETFASRIALLNEENQKLRNEINILKGEQGKPDIRKQTAPPKDISSESERAPRNKSKKRRVKKKGVILADRTERCIILKADLPADVQFKGLTSVIVQDIKICTNNVEFQKEVYYSPSLNKTFIAPNPPGYEGEFGPAIKALILDMHHKAQATESSIGAFLENHGVHISLSTVSRILTGNLGDFHAEKEAIVSAGLGTGYQQMDDTSARIKGLNHYTHILCNSFYTAYFTRRHKDRLTILEILAQGEMRFHFNEIAYGLMEEMGLSVKRLQALRLKNPASSMNREEVEDLLTACFPNPQNRKGYYARSQRIIREASAIAAYQALPHAVSILLADDAPQFKSITEFLGLCWVHDGRHYKKLDPVLVTHKNILAGFQNMYWEYYRKLLAYKAAPDINQAALLQAEFKRLFETRTGYEELDNRIAKTKLKEASLLLVLYHPELPLHNNASELGARKQARYRDISLHTMSRAGTDAKDTFMTIVETAKKLAVNTYDYFYDRLTKKYKMNSLANAIKEKFQHVDFTYHSTA